MEFLTKHVEQTQELAKNLSKHIRPGDNISLEGPLGAGKTSFVRALIASLGYKGLITSPTFTLVNEYSIELNRQNHVLVHSDLYRLEDASELFELGLEEPLISPHHVLLVEWANKFPEFKSKLDKSIHLSIMDPTSRKIIISGYDAVTL